MQDDRMREAAREIAAEVEQSVARLQREQPELEKRLAEKQAQLDFGEPRAEAPGKLCRPRRG